MPIRHSRPLYLYESPGEQNVRAASRTQAAWAFALRKSARIYGRNAGASVREIGYSDDDYLLFEVDIGTRGQRALWDETIYIRVRCV